MAHAHDVTGQKWGRLTAIQRHSGPGEGHVHWVFRCECGNEIVRRISVVKLGNGTQSCGCYRAAKALLSDPRELNTEAKPNPSRQLGKPAPEVLKRVLDYQPQTGLFFWKERTALDHGNPANLAHWNKTYAGKQALKTVAADGYLCGMIFSRLYKAHAVAWAVHYGYWPSLIDHINRNIQDNRIANLRDTTPQVNVHNSGKSNRLSPYKGVYALKDGKSFIATIGVDGKRLHLGTFRTAEEAARAYDKGAEIYYGSHSFKNFPTIQTI